MAQVITAWPTRCSSAASMFLRDVVNTSAATPGRPSGVCSPGASSLMPASQPQPMIEVAKPVAASAAVRAQPRSSPVTMRREPHIPKASANVSSISHSVDVHERLAPFPEGHLRTPRQRMAAAQRLGFADEQVIEHAAARAAQIHGVHEIAQAAVTGQSLAEKGGPLRGLAADAGEAFDDVHRSEPAQGRRRDGDAVRARG